MTSRLSALFLLALLLAPSAVRGKDEWIEARSEHFTILTDGGKGAAEDVLEDLEQLRRLIAQSFTSQPLDSPVPLSLYAFRSEKSMRSYQPMRDGKPEEWAAFFRPQPFEDFIAFRAGGGRDEVRELVFRQYLHLLLSYARVSYPLWLGNGLAAFYGNAYVTKGHAEVGKMHPRHRRELGEFRSLQFPELFSVTYDSPRYRDESLRPLFDAQCWALVHYLLIGRSPDGEAALGRFLSLLAEGKDQTLAFQEAMKEPIDVTEEAVGTYIRKRISQYWNVELQPLDAKRDFRATELRKAVADARLGKLLIAVGRRDEARARLEAAIEAGPDDPDGYEGMGFLSIVENDSTSAAPFLEKALSRGATNPMAHFHYARALLQMHPNGSEIPEPVRASALSALKKTLEADPTHAESARLFGFLRLFDGDPQEGVDVVKKALDANGGNPYLLFVLGQLYGRQENYSAARAIYENLLSRKLSPELNADVRRQLDWVVAKAGTP